MVATWYGGTSSSSDTTWDVTGTVTGATWLITRNTFDPYADWQQQQRELARIRLYEQSRAWVKAPAVIKVSLPFTLRNFLCHRHISPRPWSGRNFHK